jgi:hypothetical protein
MGHFERFFKVAQDNLGVKKALTPSINLKEWPIHCFDQEKKITPQTLRIRSTLVFLCPYPKGNFGVISTVFRVTGHILYFKHHYVGLKFDVIQRVPSIWEQI